MPEANPGPAAELARALSLSPLAARVLAHRGLADPSAASRFLYPGFDDLHDPLALRDMQAAVERLARAIRDRERILIYGDYDVDGTTSVVLLTKAIELAGGNVDALGHAAHDVAALHRAMDELQRASHAMSEHLYAGAKTAPGAGEAGAHEGPSPDGAAGAKPDDVIDVEFEEKK